MVQDPSLRNELLQYQNICNTFKEQKIPNILSQVQIGYFFKHQKSSQVLHVTNTMFKRIRFSDYIYIGFVNASMKN